MVNNLQYSHIKNWIECVCVVDFHINEGHKIEFIHPTIHRLSDSEINFVKHVSLPEMNTEMNGNHAYHFRINTNNSLKICPGIAIPSLYRLEIKIQNNANLSKL